MAATEAPRRRRQAQGARAQGRLRIADPEGLESLEDGEQVASEPVGLDDGFLLEAPAE
jgi:hypothetical protein